MANLSDAKGQIIITVSEEMPDDKFKNLVDEILDLAYTRYGDYGIQGFEHEHYGHLKYTGDFTGTGRWNFTNFLREAVAYTDKTQAKQIFNYEWQAQFDFIDVSFDDMFLYKTSVTWEYHYDFYDLTNKINFDVKDQISYPFTAYNLIDIAGYPPYEFSSFIESDEYVKKFLRYTVVDNHHLTDRNQTTCLHAVNNLSPEDMENIRKEFDHFVWCSSDEGDEEIICDYLLDLNQKEAKK